ncbi:calcium-activated potassium channel subunit beta-2 isoform X1 [Poecilia reticulata]|uniref:calcium-activated potassium channel subunit beta-2 isoform X1 n=2 Tax=Poecilia reticulata TaxID=8081 RepID=UPI0004A49860|nr:PREDICTED: calcium-activated potassium channel subunit beta-2-like isoform X1 [Poecilia reticulata]
MNKLCCTGKIPQRSFQQSHCCGASASGGVPRSSGKMFFVAGARNAAASGRENERRSIYQKFREVDILDKKKTVTALKPGEDRAILLGLGMILCSMMMYFVLGITVLRSCADSVWTEEGTCAVINSTVTGDVNCSYSCGSDCWRVSRFPCLQVYVSVNNTGRIGRLSHNEETQDASSECVYIPRCQKDSAAMRAVIVNISHHLKTNQHVSCYYDPSEQQDTVLLTRLYDHSTVFHTLLWPSCTLTVGALIIVMVKLSQYLSRLCEEIGKIKRLSSLAETLKTSTEQQRGCSLFIEADWMFLAGS